MGDPELVHSSLVGERLDHVHFLTTHTLSLAVAGLLLHSLSSSFSVIMKVAKISFVALVSHAFLKSASAVYVYTDPASWEAAVLSKSACISTDDFSGPNIKLRPGTTDVGLFDVTVNDLWSTPLGQIDGEFFGRIYDNSGAPCVLNFHNFDNAPVIAVAGYWKSTTTGGKLTVKINGQTIKFSDHLTNPSSGEGFLGFIDSSNGINKLAFGTEGGFKFADEIFTLDDLMAGGACPDCPNGGCQGDPHFKTWRGQHFDYHGECDLVLIKSDNFESGMGLDVHIRTKIRRDMAYISSAALRIGSDVLEVESQGVYWLNGVLSADVPNEFSGFAFSHTQPTDKQHVFEVHLGDRERIKVKTYKDFVSVLVEWGQSKHFIDSVGLMGDFRMGHMIARDGKTVLDDANAFGQEWQVLDTEPTLFQTLRLPQHPMECTMPPPMQASQLRRRLLESSSVTELAAEEACAHWGEGTDNCVFDVLTTGDLEMAMVGSY
jgi:hypothetical protein